MKWKRVVVLSVVACASALLLGPALSRAVFIDSEGDLPRDALRDHGSPASASIALAKTVGTDPSMCADTDEIDVAEGTAVTYCFEVSNIGPTTLTLHDLEDSELGVLFEGLPFSLFPDATVFITQTAIITQTTVNAATWTAYNPGPVDVAVSTDSATVNLVPPTISLRKTVGTDSSKCADTDEIDVVEGTAVTYCFEVTNTGPTTLTLHDLGDSELGVILDGFNFSLFPDATIFLTQTAVITQTTVNTAVWTAYNPGPVDVAVSTDSATVNVVPPTISLRKTVGTDPSLCPDTHQIDVDEGTAVTYCFEVSNIGPTTLTLHDLEDSELEVIFEGLPFSLFPDATVFITQTAIITQTTVNAATWTAYNPGPLDVAVATDWATVIVPGDLYLPLVVKE